MNVYIMRLTKDKGLSSTEKLILLLIVDCVNTQAPCTTEKIAYLLNLKCGTVYKAIIHLVSAGLLTKKGKTIDLGFDL